MAAGEQVQRQVRGCPLREPGGRQGDVVQFGVLPGERSERAFDAEDLDIVQAGCGELVAEFGGVVVVGDAVEGAAVGVVAVLQDGDQVPVDVGGGQLVQGGAFGGLGPPRHRRRDHHAAGADPDRLGQGTSPVGGGREVVQRAEKEDRVPGAVVEREASRVSDLCWQASCRGLLDVLGDRIEHLHLVAGVLQPGGVPSRGAADVQDPRRRWREPAGQEFAGAVPLHPVAFQPETGVFVTGLVHGDDVGCIHDPSVAAGRRIVPLDCAGTGERCRVLMREFRQAGVGVSLPCQSTEILLPAERWSWVGIGPTGLYDPSGGKIVAMIPISPDVVPKIDLAGNLRLVTPYEVVRGFSVVRDYGPMVSVTWQEAMEALSAEAHWLDRASRADDQASFDEVLDAAVEEESGDEGDWLFQGIDLGVAGLVLVLSALGYATCYSCRGHARYLSEQMPQVRLATEPERLALLVECARGVGCGLDLGGDGLVTIYAPSVSELHALAQLLASHRADFDTLPPPPWLSRALAALEQGEDFRLGRF